MPSWELFAAQPEHYRDAVLPPSVAPGSRSRRRVHWAGPAGPPTRVHGRDGRIRRFRPGRAIISGVQAHRRSRWPKRCAITSSNRGPPSGGPNDVERGRPRATRCSGWASWGRVSGTITSPAISSRRRARTTDRRRRAARHDVESHDLREGDRGQPALRRGHPPAVGSGPHCRRDLRGAGCCRRPGRMRRLPPLYSRPPAPMGSCRWKSRPRSRSDTDGTIHEAAACGAQSTGPTR